MEENRLEKYLAVFVGLMAFTLRFSSAAASITTGIAMLLGLIYWYTFKEKISISEDIKGYMKTYGVFLLLLVPSIVFSDKPAVSIREFFQVYIWHYAVFILIVLFIKRREYLVNMLMAFLSIISVESLLTLGQILNNKSRGGGFSPPTVVTTLGGILSMVLPVVIVILMDPCFEKKLKKISAVAAASVIVGLLCNKSRGAWLTELIVVPIATFRYLKQNKVYLAVMVAVLLGIAGFMVSSPQYVRRVQSITNITTDRSNADRIRVWKSSKKMILDYPVTGVGLGRFHEIYMKKYRLRKERQHLKHAHNNFIQITAESGIIGLAGLLYFIGYYLYHSLRNYRNRKNPYDILIFTTFFGYICLFGLIAYSLGSSTGMRIMWFILAVLLKLKETEVYQLRRS